MAGVNPSPGMAVVAANGTDFTDDKPAAASGSDGNNTAEPPPAEVVDPELLMAARLGNREKIMQLLHLRISDADADPDAGQQAGTEVAAPAAEDMPPVGAEEVVVQVDPPAAGAVQPSAAASLRLHEDGEEKGTPERDMCRSPNAATGTAVAAAQDEITAEIDAAAPAAPLPPLDGAAVTIEGDSLLHVIAASGDSEKFLHCAKMIVHDKKLKGGAAAMRYVLEARNHRGDTSLHCAAAAGNAKMISCLVDLVATTVDDDEDTAAVKKAFLEAQNKYGETVLHHVIKRAGMMHNRHGSKNTPAAMLYKKHVLDAFHMIENLMSMDPDLACIVTHEGTSPLFLAISLGEMEIARYLIVKAKEGDLSYYSGSDGQNILHAAVSCGDIRGDS